MFIYMFLTYHLVSTIFYTGINVPYASLNGLMTTDPYERGLLGNFRMILSNAGTMTVNTFVLNLFTNNYWVLVLITLVVMYFMVSCFYDSVAYFVRYVMGDLDVQLRLCSVCCRMQLPTDSGRMGLEQSEWEMQPHHSIRIRVFAKNRNI